jgi:hypothetical protein
MKNYSSLHNIFLFQIYSFLLLLHFNSFAQVGIATTTPLSTFEVNGSIGQTISIVNSDLTLDGTHSVIICDNGSITRTITLPNSIGIKGRIYSIKRSENSTENVIIATSSSQLIDGESNFVLSQAKETISVISDGANWKVIGRYISQLPVGELSYFSITGTLIPINSATLDGSFNMFLCNPATTLSADSVSFISTQNGRLQYTGTTKRSFRIVAVVSAMPNSSGVYLYEFRKSNTNFILSSRVIEKLTLSEEKTTSIQVFLTLDPNDSVELWVGKIGDAGSVTVKSLNLFALGI